MERTTISLPEELLQRLRLIAAERRTSMAALIREAVEEKGEKSSSQTQESGDGRLRIHRYLHAYRH
jgi:predicted transcriptional regulator